MRHTTRYLLAAALVASCVTAHAAGPAQALATLGSSDKAFQSRTCGLVLLSAGRAQVRLEAAKAEPAYDNAMAQLTAAFMLLRDGASVPDRTAPRTFFAERLSTGNTTRPAQQALPEAVAHCSAWFNSRKSQPDFDNSQEALWSALEQAQITLRSE